MRSIRGVVFMKDMISLFGRIRFHHMDLYFVDGMSLLLDACTETLETLRFCLTDPRGEKLCPKDVEALTNDFAAGSSLRNFGLSRNKSLRALEVTAQSVNNELKDRPSNPASSLLNHILSTITSPTFLEVMVLYRDYCDFPGIQIVCACETARPLLRRTSQAERAEEALRYHRQFEVFREAQKVRDFQLVLCADAWDNVGEYPVRVLKRAVAAEKAKGMFDNFSSEPMVIHSPRAAITGVWKDVYGTYTDIRLPWKDT